MTDQIRPDTSAYATNEHGQPVGRPVIWTPPPAIDPDVLSGRTCRLERLTVDHAASLAESLFSAGVDAVEPLFTYLPWPTPADADDVRTHVETVVAIPGWSPLAIVVDGACVGHACYLRTDTNAGSTEVGGILYTPALQRTTAATETMHLMAQHAFELGYRRYEWKCDDLNGPSRAAARRLGFSYEGTFHHAQVYKGRNRDTAWYAMTADDWQRLAPAYDTWLDDTNFVDGVQQQSLSTLTREALA